MGLNKNDLEIFMCKILTDIQDGKDLDPKEFTGEDFTHDDFVKLIYDMQENKCFIQGVNFAKNGQKNPIVHFADQVSVTGIGDLFIEKCMKKYKI